VNGDNGSSDGVLDQLRLSMGLNDNNLGIEIMSQFGADMLDAAVPWGCTSRPRWIPGLKDAVNQLSSADINVLLYRTAPEERDTIGQSVYNIPGFGPLVYCGLQGLVSVLFPVIRNNNLGHPICSNLRQGPWLYDYVLLRLQKYLSYNPGLKPMLDWLTSRLELVKKLPPSFAPKYFSIVIICAFEAVKHQLLFGVSLSQIPPKVLEKDPSSLDVFAFSCAMTAFQCYGSVKSTGLLPKPYPLPLKAPEQLTPVSSIRGMPLSSLAAGLPHFSVEYARCWGRDIFIALRGLFLIPGNFAAARAHLLAFGSTLKHGLIPNLLDQGIRPRYNARDAVWFWINSVFDYCRESPEGLSFLDVSIARRFIPLKRYRNPNFGEDKPGSEDPDSDDYILPNDERVYKYSNTVAQLCHEILERHMAGIDFREWNAGSSIDHAMRSEGFNISVSIDEASGFLKGGSRWNCGTWMDKMGDSGASGNLGVPATPRDGSAIELVGLQKAALTFITGTLLGQKTAWIWKGVSYNRNGKQEYLDYVSWEEKIQTNFEKYFYIPIDASLDSKYEISRPDLINRRGIYKDTFGSSITFSDYQLRPNVCIAMVKV
jgi:glycogen debranching enzyme